ncbi:unnamed protein product [Darwinula stevensoni]|uniref:Uncharacterized protein n=1 Tax=Darwinula stevensoni TaxID=69355 RepID=A0A7R8XL53_9CRUS|nr:unnamed protein product [Darwinula stevensoni]CAG0893868.1 unnamed protein product [Darwinula stevensoni]
MPRMHRRVIPKGNQAMEGCCRKFHLNERRPTKSLWRTIKGTCYNFYLSSSLPGLANARQHTNPMIQRIWIAVFLAGTAVTLYSVSQVVADYLSYPVITYVSMSHARKMTFPAVTLCNSNPIVCFKLGQLRDLLPELWDISGCKISSFSLTPVSWLQSSDLNQEELKNGLDRYLQEVVNTTELALTVVDQGNAYTKNLSLLSLMAGKNKQSRLDSLLKCLLYVAPVEFKARNGSKALDVLISYVIGQGNLTFTKTLSSIDLLSTTTQNSGSIRNYVKLLETFSKVNLELKRKIVNSMESFIWKCTFQGADCLHKDNFQQVIIPQYGTCFMFNTAWNPNDSRGGKRITGKTGEETGLSLELYLNKVNYVRNPTASSVGARVTIHSPNEWPNPIEQGYMVQPNTRNVFALQVVNMSRLGSPYSTDCFSDWKKTEYKPYSKDNPNASLAYSQVQCVRLREKAEIAKKCRCLYPEIQDKFLHNGVSYEGYPTCNISIGSEDQRCIVNEETLLQTLSPICNPSCREIAYDIALSTSFWPAETYFDKLLSRALVNLGYEDAYDRFRDKPDEYQNLLEQLQKGMVKVEIIFRSLNLHVIEEQPKYDLNGMVSNLGGVLGIYLGICAVMLIEIAEFLILLHFNIIRHFFGTVSDGDEPPRNAEGATPSGRVPISTTWPRSTLTNPTRP